MTPKAATMLALALALSISDALWAQAGIPTLSVTVSDPSGAAVPNTTVSVKNLSTGQSIEAHANASGEYTVSGIIPGDYEVSAAAEGFGIKTAKVSITAGEKQTVNLVLTAVSPTGAPSLGDLGFTPAQAKGSAQDQARLDKRSHMLKTHQRLGLITAAPLLATLISSGGAKGKNGSASGRELHAALGSITAGMYLTTASFAIFAPKIPGTTVRGPIRVHKALAWIHGPGMILTPVLGALAYDQRSRGEKIHGLAQAHAPVAAVTGIAYGLAILSVSIKF